MTLSHCVMSIVSLLVGGFVQSFFSPRALLSVPTLTHVYSYVMYTVMCTEKGGSHLNVAENWSERVSELACFLNFF